MFDVLESIHPYLPLTAGLLLLTIAAVLADLFSRLGLVRVVRAITARLTRNWHSELSEQRVFSRAARIVPSLVIFSGIDLVRDVPDGVVVLVRNVTMAFVILMVAMTLAALLRAGNRVYEQYPVSRNRPIKGIVQVLQIVIYILATILIIATLLERSPLLLLSGFGAMTAVLLLVFRDTILGLVASVQLSSQDMVRVGDWIEMPSAGADGDVIDVALHTVKVRNFDRTITTIPTYKLIEQSFRNWRGMRESGGRRIKRPVYIDQNTIRFLTRDETEHFKQFVLLREYVERKEGELDEYHASLDASADLEINRRRLTNIGTFRAYVFNYLQQHPHVHDQLIKMVRQLAPGPEGLPLEIYCFTRSTEWVVYEGVQADIFDHVIAILPEFGLRIFQRPAGTDFAGLLRAADAVAPHAAGVTTSD